MSDYLRTLTLNDLYARRWGCTEQVCPVHGDINREIARRLTERKKT